MFCKYCGNPIKDGAGFCSSCGASAGRGPVDGGRAMPLDTERIPQMTKYGAVPKVVGGVLAAAVVAVVVGVSVATIAKPAENNGGNINQQEIVSSAAQSDDEAAKHDATAEVMPNGFLQSYEIEYEEPEQGTYSRTGTIEVDVSIPRPENPNLSFLTMYFEPLTSFPEVSRIVPPGCIKQTLALDGDDPDVISYEYDASGRVVRENMDASNGEIYTADYEYGGNGKLEHVDMTGSLNYEFDFDYDVAPSVTVIEESSGSPGFENTYLLFYDAGGKLARILPCWRSSSGGGLTMRDGKDGYKKNQTLSLESLLESIQLAGERNGDYANLQQQEASIAYLDDHFPNLIRYEYDSGFLTELTLPSTGSGYKYDMTWRFQWNGSNLESATQTGWKDYVTTIKFNWK